MKKLLTLFAISLAIVLSSCSTFDDEAIWNKLDDHESRISRLEEMCREMNSNIDALQTIVTALQTNDYVTSVTPVTKDGETVGYTITFTKSDPITIYHGTDGKDGANGKDGKDGGYTPIIGVKQDADGIYYWTLDGEWLLDENGNKIKAQGTDGKDGIDGADGKDGINGTDGKDGIDGADGKDGADGITPLLKIENDYWYISYDNGASWTQLGKATGEDGKDGADGKDGDSFFQSVTQDEQFVYFTLADGTVITLPKGAALDITFAESDLVVMSTDSTREIDYTVTSVTEKVTVEVTSSADIRAKVVTADATGKRGSIKITTGSTIDEYSKVIVFVSNGDKVIMRSITFEEAGLMVEENATLYAVAEGGEVALNFLTNVECEVVIPEEAQDWISVVPATRAMEKQTITLKLEPNEGYYRSATVTVQSSDGTLKLEYQVEQDGELGVEIDPTQIPDNEIWYISIDGKEITFDYNNFESAKLVSHVYKHGKGVLTFDIDVAAIPNMAFYDNSRLVSIILPNTIENIGNEAFYNCINLRDIYWGNSLTSIGERAFVGCDLRTVIIPSSVTKIYPGAFECCKNLTDVVINGSLDYLSNSIFSSCENLRNITLPSTLKEIHSYAFFNCYNLKQIPFPSSLEIIQPDAFVNSGLEIVELPESLVELPREAFQHCNTIKEFHGKYASDDFMFLSHNGYMFAYATGAGRYEYSIPEGVKKIECNTFWNDKNINKITLPSTIENIACSAFLGCENLEYIYGTCATADNKCAVINGVLELFAGKGIKEYVLPDCVREIGGGVFSYNKELSSLIMSDNVLRAGVDKRFLNDRSHFLEHSPNLKQITLSAKIHDLGYGFFYGCSSLESIYCRNVIPPTLSEVNISEGTPTPIIYVPEQSLETYMVSPDWIPFKDYIKGYKYTDLPENDTYISSDYSKDGTITTLQTATKGNGIDIVLMGDAYSDRQIADGTYMTDMEYIYNNLFTEEPYKSFKDHFNVHYVNVVSAAEGYEYGNTALDGYFGDGTLVGGNDNAVFDYALNAISEEEMDEALLIVAMNSDNYAGTCYMYWPTYTTGTYGSGPSVAYFPRGGDAETFAQLLHHEACGHGFAKLADEYAYEYMGAVPSDYASEIQSQQANWGWWKNVDFTSDTSAIRWSNFINDARYANEGLGAFEGGLTYWSGVWRPSENSIMRHNTGGFNAPSREAIYYRIHKLAYGDSWEYDYEEFVEWDAINRTAAAAAKRKSTKPATYKPTHAPIIVNKSWRDAK